MAIGTPQYMAPESIRHPDSVDARGDIYSLGAVAYFLLAGVDVFDGKSVVEVCSQHLYQVPPTFAEKGISVAADLEAVVLACLEKDPARRPQTAMELRSRLEACRITPWDRDSALAWWRDYPAADDDEVVLRSGDALTIAVDAERR